MYRQRLKEAFDAFLGGLILLLVGLVVLGFSTTDWLTTVAIVWIFLMSLICIISILAMIPWMFIFKTLGLLVIILLLAYFLLPEGTAESISGEEKTAFLIAAYIAVLVIYLFLYLLRLLFKEIYRFMNTQDRKRTIGNNNTFVREHNNSHNIAPVQDDPFCFWGDMKSSQSSTPRMVIIHKEALKKVRPQGQYTEISVSLDYKHGDTQYSLKRSVFIDAEGVS